MVDIPGFFWGNDPNANLELRRRIALGMMSQKKGFPKTVGEGLTSIGDAIGDLGLARRIEREDSEAQGRARALGSDFASAGSESTNAAAAPPAVAQDEPAPPAPTTLTNTPVQPSAMLGEDSRMPGLNTPPNQMTPQQQSALLSPTAEPAAILPSDRFAPQPQPQPQQLADDAGYNMIDAQAGMKRPGQGRVQDAVMRAFAGNPDMQAYASQLAAGEQRKPGEVSKTGARGPWQFVPGTAAQYGLTNPDDVDASAQALKAFTADNARVFEQRNGRPPTMAELAVMHQQGGTTGANMVAGTGNATPRNLALNNVNPAASPAQATAAIKGYYGMPDRQVDARGAVAAQLAARRPPVMASDEPDARGQIAQVLAARAMPPQAPAQAPQALQAPPAPPAPQRIAQAPGASPGGPGTPGYVIPDQAPPQAPPRLPVSPQERAIIQKMNANQGNPYAAQVLKPYLDEATAQRAHQQSILDKAFEAKQKTHEALILEQQKQKGDQSKRYYEVQELQQKIQAGPHTVVDGRLMAPDPSKPPGSPWIDITAPVPGSTAGGPPQINMTKEQADNVKFLTQMYTTAAQLKGKEKLLAEGLKDEMSGKVPFVGNALLSRDYRLAKRAAEFWVAANLRDVSGAVIGTKEHADQMKWLMPQYGDDDAALKDKEARRNSVTSGMYNGLGKAQPAADYSKKQIHDEHANAQKKINEEMSHLKNMPKGYVAQKGKMKRVFDGTNWLDM
jgi:hypothetical protein